MSLEIPEEIREEAEEEQRQQHLDWLYEPEVDLLAGKVSITFPNLKVPIKLNFEGWNDGSGNSRRAEADIDIYYNRFGRKRPIYSARYGLRQPTLTKGTVDFLYGRTSASFEQWGEVIPRAYLAAISAFRKGQPSVDIRTVERRRGLDYAVYPIIIKNNPSIIFGTGGLGKSLLGCYLGIRAALGSGTEDGSGRSFNSDFNDGLVIHDIHRVGYLDWEADPEEVKDRWAALADGLQIVEPHMEYRRMHGSLESNFEAVRDMVADNNLSLLVVDSALPATGGEAETAKATENFFNALSSLRCSSLIIAHQAKPQLGFSSTTPFGSTFWWNEGRSIWQIAAENEGPGLLEVGLFHKKVNSGPKHDDMGFHIEFLEADPTREFSKILVGKLNLNTSELRSHLGNTEQIEAILNDPRCNPTGFMTAEAIADASTNLSRKQVEQSLTRGKHPKATKKNPRAIPIFYNDEKNQDWCIYGRQGGVE